MVTTSVEGSALLRVISVRAQNRNGAIFRGQRITRDGGIVDTHGEVTVRLQGKGVAAKVMAGQWWEVSGVLSTKTFVNAGGFAMTEEHIEVSPGAAEMRLPSGAHIVEYLARNPRFEGVGRVTAEKLWETFREELVSLLDQGDYQALADVVSPAKTACLIEGWAEEGLSKTLQWLQAHGVSLKVGRRILNYFGTEALSKIQEDPYRLLSFAAGWAEIDALATQQMGVDHADERRLAAAVEEVVYRRFSLGDTYVQHGELVDGLKRLLEGQASTSLVSEAITNSERSGRLLFDLQGNAYSLGASILEDRVVECIQVRLDQHSPAADVSGIIRDYEAREGNGFHLNDEQHAAVHMVADHHFSVITGGAGCGKTTVLRAACEVLEAQGYTIVQLALAGKAVKRMMESTGRPAMTLASFIKKFSEDKETDADKVPGQTAILIDEASMVDLISFAAVVRLLDKKVKIVLIGDPHQLPPVGPGLILHCLIDVSVVPHVELKVAKRFGSEIAEMANRIRDGVLPILAEQGPVQIQEVDENEIAAVACKLYLERPSDTVVLSATRSVAATINQMVQEAMSAGRREVRVWNEEFDCWEASGIREGDLVICTQNHWDLGVQNGSMGRVVTVEAADEAIGEIEWDDGIVRKFDASLLDSLALGYALTVHKSQGSQWKRVVTCLPTPSRMIDRSLVYTAVTRAQEEVILLGKRAPLTELISRQKTADRRRVGLSKRLVHALPEIQ